MKPHEFRLAVFDVLRKRGWIVEFRRSEHDLDGRFSLQGTHTERDEMEAIADDKDGKLALYFEIGDYYGRPVDRGWPIRLYPAGYDYRDGYRSIIKDLSKHVDRMADHVERIGRKYIEIQRSRADRVREERQADGRRVAIVEKVLGMDRLRRLDVEISCCGDGTTDHCISGMDDEQLHVALVALRKHKFGR